MSVSDVLLIIGCGGHARSVSDVALSSGFGNLVFWDTNAKENETLFGFPVLSTKSVLENSENIFFAVGDNQERAEYVNLLKDKNIINIIAQNAYIASSSTIGKGIFVGHGAHIGPMAMVGDNTIINTHAVVEHESIVGKHSHISVNATVSGRCKIGDYVFVGAGTVLRDKISICSHVVIGAGSVVVKNITEPGVYVGSPAKKIK